MLASENLGLNARVCVCVNAITYNNIKKLIYLNIFILYYVKVQNYQSRSICLYIYDCVNLYRRGDKKRHMCNTKITKIILYDFYSALLSFLDFAEESTTISTHRIV